MCHPDYESLMSSPANVSEADMSHDEKNDEGTACNVGSIGKSEKGRGTPHEAPSKAGCQSAQLGRKVVGQGKRRETLKKWIKEQD